MLQEERTERARTQILDAALKLFAHRGYGATTVREIAEAAGLSHGNVYYHFPDKEVIFRALLQRYMDAVSQPDFPLNQVLASGTFPDNLEEVGLVIRDMVRDYREYVALVYVDVVEFDGEHIRKFYSGMALGFQQFLKEHRMEGPLRKRLQQGISPHAAVMLAVRMFLNYFGVEIVFGVKDHFGKSSDEAVREISHILRHGMLRSGKPLPPPKKKDPAAARKAK
ncbi:MAG: TetR/AcrR family transcriptional regulator, partial [Thermoanaerobaculia bacterium]